MIHYQLPTSADLLALGTPRADALSIYLPTEPTPAGRDVAFTTAKSAVDQAIRTLRTSSRTHAEQEALRDQWNVIADDSELWGNLGSSLVIFLAPGFADEYVLPNNFEPRNHFGDRFDLGPLVRAVTTPQRAYALTLSSSGWNLWQATESSRAEEFELVGDVLGDLQRGGRGGRRGVEDMQLARPVREEEVLHERAVGAQRLRAYAGRRRHQRIVAQGRHEFAQ